MKYETDKFPIMKRTAKYVLNPFIQLNTTYIIFSGHH